jgi:hypothetical protein
MTKRLANVTARLRVFTGELRHKYSETGKEVFTTLPIDHTDEYISKRYAERIFRKWMHHLLKLEDKSNVDPELLAMAATGLQVNIVLVEEVKQEPSDMGFAV